MVAIAFGHTLAPRYRNSGNLRGWTRQCFVDFNAYMARHSNPGILALITMLFALNSVNAQYNTTNSPNTLFVVGYTIWWTPNGGTDFCNVDVSSMNNAATAERNTLQAGGSTVSYVGVYAIPSLSATVSKYDGSGQTSLTTPTSAKLAPNGGYYSNNDDVILYHSKLIANLGVQAIMPDMTNGIAALFRYDNPHLNYQTTEDSAALLGTNPGDYQQNFARLLRDIDGGLNGVPPLYLIPAIGAQNAADLSTDGGSDNRSPFQRALRFMAEAMKVHYTRSVLVSGGTGVMAGGKPTIVVYVGPSNTIANKAAAMSQAAVVAADLQAAYGSNDKGFTIRFLTATADWIPDLRSGNLASLNPPYMQLIDGVWSWYDRVYNEGEDSFSTYCMIPGTSSPEFTSVVPTSWPSAAPFLALRAGEQIFHHMSKAKRLHPKIVMVNQFNQFLNDQGGYTVDARMNIEPTIDGSGNVNHQIYDLVQRAIQSYRASESGIASGRIVEMTFRGQVGPQFTGNGQFIAGFTLGGADTITPQRVIMKAMGPSLKDLLPNENCVLHPQLELRKQGGTFVAINSAFGTIASSDIATYAVASNDGADIAATELGAPKYANALKSRVFRSSSAYLNALNYGRPIRSNEPAITADLDPGEYTVMVNEMDGAYSGYLPGPMAHLRVIPDDVIGPNSVTKVVVRGYVGPQNNAFIISIKVDAQKTISVRGRGPNLVQYVSPCLAYPQLTFVSETNGSSTAESWAGEEWQTKTLQPGTVYSFVLQNGDPSTGFGVGMIEIQ